MNRSKEIYKVTLPELKPFKLIWRAIASSVAIAISFYPFLLIGLIALGISIFTNPIDIMSSIMQLFTSAYIGLLILFLLLFPGLMWNYAKQNSVFAGLNIRKAIYLLGNYPAKYLMNTFLIILVSAISGGVTYFLSICTGLGKNVDINIYECIFYLVTLFISLYTVYINAYLLGTISKSWDS